MSRFDVIGHVNDPGAAGKGGDDRFGFDMAAGTAWVIDGATDVTDLRPFPRAESSAAWLAEALSTRLMRQAPQPGEALKAYWKSVLEDVRANAEQATKIPLERLPGEAMPIAACMWLQTGAAGAVTFTWLADCVALLARMTGKFETIGQAENIDAETDDARAVLNRPASERRAALRAQRAAQTADPGHAFGLHPQAATHVHEHTANLAPGDEILLVTDGLYRLISPYASHTPQTLFELVRREDLNGAVRALRAQEGETSAIRIKASDDACGLWLRYV